MAPPPGMLGSRSGSLRDIVGRGAHRRWWLTCLAVIVLSAAGAEAAECPGRPQHWRPTATEFDALLTAHVTWRRSNGTNGCRANLSDADLRGANLGPVDLTGALLRSVDLSSANLRGAVLAGSDLRSAQLSHSDLSEAYLPGTDLERASLYYAQLTGAILAKTRLSSAALFGANLSGADLSGVVLETALLSEAKLIAANLTRADLKGAILFRADLSRARLDGANLSGASFHSANVTEAHFEPFSIQDVLGLELASGLSTLRFTRTPTALVLLRDDFRKRGLHAEARELTYAIRRQQREHAWREWTQTTGFWRRLWDRKARGDTIAAGWSAVDAGFNYAAFEITCLYGLNRGRPLLILAALVPVFAVFYMIALIVPTERGSIWRTWAPDRIRQDQGRVEPEQLRASAPRWQGGPQRGSTYRLLRVLALGFYMSVLSAFHIGWRDLNVGAWIGRLQPREYTLRATGWVRSVSGLQSLISVYLIALWVLTYFGRPFD